MSNVSYDYMSTEFLKRCFTCKRQIAEMKEIYMYMDMSFCSEDCRHKQMDKDTKEEIKNRVMMRKNKRHRKNVPPKGNDKANFFVGDA